MGRVKNLAGRCRELGRRLAGVRLRVERLERGRAETDERLAELTRDRADVAELWRRLTALSDLVGIVDGRVDHYARDVSELRDWVVANEASYAKHMDAYHSDRHPDDKQPGPEPPGDDQCVIDARPQPTTTEPGVPDDATTAADELRDRLIRSNAELGNAMVEMIGERDRLLGVIAELKRGEDPRAKWDTDALNEL